MGRFVLAITNINKSRRKNMKQAPFSRARGCECRAWKLDKAQDFGIKVLHLGEECEVCLFVRLALFTSNLGNKNWENKDR